MKFYLPSMPRYTSFSTLLTLTLCLLSISITSAQDELAESTESTTYKLPQNYTHTSTLLTNFKSIPLIAVGLGDVSKKDVTKVMSKTISNNDLQYHMFDTPSQSGNEKIISSLSSRDSKDDELHIVSKIPYTHLGYDRTKLAVTKTLVDTQPNNIKLHILIAWPRCYDVISPTTCDEEENALPSHVKDAGPSPLLDPNTFLDSWRALEELYVRHAEIVSIGVANFETEDWILLLNHCNIVPHVHQGGLWDYLENTELVEILHESHVLFQVENIMRLIMAVEENHNVSVRLRELAVATNVDNIATLILAYFLQKRMGVVIANGFEGRFDVSPAAISAVGSLERDYGYISELLHHVVREIEVPKNTDGMVVVTLINKMKKDMKVFWVDQDDETLHEVHFVAAEGERDITSHPGHKFAIKHDDNPEIFKMFEVTADRGEHERFEINDEL